MLFAVLKVSLNVEIVLQRAVVYIASDLSHYSGFLWRVHWEHISLADLQILDIAGKNKRGIRHHPSASGRLYSLIVTAMAVHCCIDQLGGSCCQCTVVVMAGLVPSVSSRLICSSKHCSHSTLTGSLSPVI